MSGWYRQRRDEDDPMLAQASRRRSFVAMSMRLFPNPSCPAGPFDRTSHPRALAIFVALGIRAIRGFTATRAHLGARSMSNDSDNRISMKTILKVMHVYGAEPAGILLQMTTSEGEVIDIFLSKALVAETREILQTALDKYLPRQ
jgi:hypothetical protein